MWLGFWGSRVFRTFSRARAGPSDGDPANEAEARETQLLSGKNMENLRMSSKKGPFQKERSIFQPLSFEYLSFWESIFFHYLHDEMCLCWWSSSDGLVVFPSKRVMCSTHTSHLWYVYLHLVICNLVAQGCRWISYHHVRKLVSQPLAKSARQWKVPTVEEEMHVRRVLVSFPCWFTRGFRVTLLSL